MSPLAHNFPDTFLSLAQMMGISQEEFEERKTFLQFGPEDERRLQELSGLSEDNADAIIEDFYAHLLQFRLGYVAMRDATDAIFGQGLGIEHSADCMALALGATGKPGGYTSECSGARGQAAADLLAGRLP